MFEPEFVFDNFEFFEGEALNLEGIDIHSLVASRLEDMADRVEFLYVNGYSQEANLLKKEALELAQAYDNEVPFLYLEDFSYCLYQD